MHNLSTVVNFEIVRTLKKPSFWVAALLAPIGLVAYILFAGMNGYNASQVAEQGAKTEGLKMTLLDESKVIDEKLAKTAKMSIVTDKNAAIQQVKDGKVNVFYYVPEDLSKHPINIYTQTKTSTLFDNYGASIDTLLKQSVAKEVSPNQAIVLSGAYRATSTNYVQGEEQNMIGEMIIPIMALVIFYVLICLFGNRLMMSTLEEKENRISEMILTSVGSKVLIVGKIISLIALGFLQILILAIPVIVGLLNAKNITFSGVSLADILPEVVVDPWILVVSALLLIFSYVLITGLNVTVGSLVPNAREASGFVSVIMILVVMPLFFISSFMSATPDFMTYALSYFPLSAPVALLMRNAFGTLPPTETAAGIALLVVSSVTMIALAIRAFRVGTMEYQSKVSLKRLFGAKRVQ
ncbi:MAG: ABC transporter permease [Candidatus Nomurabacteria bacterium]|jgi:ABC-2 type transport system permease protein|nr:ABC transporter permease [Candidatus Nomurabacteria bacterium]